MTVATGSADRAAARAEAADRGWALVAYLVLGAYLGIVFTKSEVLSWFRIQEMFRFQSFHMYGILGSAVAIAIVTLAVVRHRRPKSLSGEPIVVPPKELGRFGTRYWVGGTLFGLGWGLLGACPGPIFALLGNGIAVMAVALLAAVAGTWTYGALRHRLPH